MCTQLIQCLLKKTTDRIKFFFRANRINHIRSPAQSPDLNPIELVWHDLKECLFSFGEKRSLLKTVTKK